ncbi:DUF2971 domain-containing protein [Mariniflexile sp. AS56]|uniref:DUF2971 domain-containing protein n=1 Tax=Mariniflexile sp. AS56 TaxID=3063957 RepID=UPI0026E97E23|nr:DUF2971 domain-containing protein [Mariniflexile sp. AS56]MDO7171033.1 DUF2971 domain-containing protein [Mariniflexile sp. AS56]
MDDEIKKAGRPYVFRFRPDSDRTIDEIVNNYIFFADRNSLNDPFDSSPELVRLTENSEEIAKFYDLISESITDKKVKEYFKSEYTTESLQKYAQSKVLDLILEFGIACFSMYIMNMPLWANYSNNHKGVCLQFNSDIDKDFFTILGPVQYQEELSQMEFMPITSEKEIGKVFFRKDKNWGYEKEVRLLKNFKRKSKFNKNALRNVILGYSADYQYVKKVFYDVKNNYANVGIYKLEKPTTFGKLTFTKIITCPK